MKQLLNFNIIVNNSPFSFIMFKFKIFKTFIIVVIRLNNY